MNFLWLGLEYIFCLTDAVFLYVFSSKAMEKKENYRWYHYLIGCLIMSILTFVLTYIDMSFAWGTEGMFSALKFVLTNALIFLYIFILYKGNVGKRIICYIISIVLYISSDLLSFVLVSSISNVALREIIFLSNTERIIGYCIARIIFVLLGTVIIYSGFKNKVLLPVRHWIAFLFIYSVMLIFANLIIYMTVIENISSIMNMFLIALALSLLFMFFCTYYLFLQMSRYYQKINEENMLNYHNELIEKYILQKEESDKIIRTLSHDLKHNLLHWKQLAESKGYSDILKGITDYERVYEESQLVDIGSDIANAIINQKLLAARKNEIQFNVKGAFSEGLSLESIDLCSLLVLCKF